MASSSNSDRNLSSPIFSGENYDYWRVKMRTLFCSYGLWKFVEIGVVEPDEDTELSIAERALVEDNLKKDARAIYLIQMGLSDDIFPRISNETRAKDAWEVLEKEFRGAAKVRSVKCQTLRRDFEYARMKENELLSRFMTKPTQIHLGTAKRVLRYIQGTLDFGIVYERNLEPKLFGFCDSGHGGNIDDGRSTSGFSFTLGSGVFSWTSKKQPSVAQSTAEVEYMAAALATSQAMWLRKIIDDLGERQVKPTTIYCDSKSAIAMVKNTIFHGKSKHIAIKHHFIREAVEDKIVEVVYCRSNDQVADIFTKALAREKFQGLRELFSVHQLSIKGEC